MSQKPKLELTWIGKDKRPQLEPRILLEDPVRSYHAKQRVSENDLFDNRLIFGDNLLALKALEAEFTGKVKCVFIDPPYNTGSAFTHYDDGLEHSIWLGLMRDRLETLRRLMSDDGSLWITIDDNEAHYLKVLCDEVFGRTNFVASMVWEKDSGRKNDTDISVSHDYVLLVAKNRERWKRVRNLLPRTDEQLERYQNPDNDPRGPWRQGADGTAKSGGESLLYPIELPSGRVVRPPKGNYWRFSKETFALALAEGRVYFGKDGNRLPVIKKYLTDIQSGVVPKTWWPADEVGSNQEARRDHLRKLLPDIEPFATPKPERLIQRVLDVATSVGDLVLDSFAGSGTTGAVAQKMGRRWIMVELGEHCHTHIIPRLQKVIDGADPGGITQAVGWKGGGGFRYYRLAPSLLERDRWGNWVISSDYDAPMLAQAVCKLQGFTYAPSDVHWWQHGHASERDFICITTQALSAAQLQALAEDVGSQRSLLVLCAAWHGVTAAQAAERWPNLTLKKIPKAVLSSCEWGHDDYSLNVANLPMAQPDTKAESTDPAKGQKRRAGAAAESGQAPLFGEDAP
ncbi:MAG: site-specific DNA-methyltransferase [Rubrivivax sp.]